MKQDNKRHILLRYAVIILFTLVFVSFIVYKLTRTAIIEAPEWNIKADSLLTVETVVQPTRGNIYADNGTLLATNLTYYTARMDMRCSQFKPDTFRKYIPALCDSLPKLLPGSTPAKWKSFFEKELSRKRLGRAVPIATNLTHSQYNALRKLPYFKERKHRFVLYSEPVTKRVKPYGQMASRSIGGMRQDTATGAFHGQSGLEMALDSLLFGTPGKSRKIQVTNNIVDWESVPAKRGYDIKTTINVEIQDIVEEELLNRCIETNASWGTAIVMEVATGAIKAISNLEWQPQIRRYIEGTNHAVLGYEPGSVVKTVSMLVALEDGLVTDINKVIVTGSSYTYAQSRISDGGHGRASMPIRGIIESSSNVGITKLLLPKYGPRPGTYYSRLRELGILEPLKSGIAGEHGFKIDSLGNENWDRIALSRQLYGYTTKVPPMNTLAIYNAIANGGKFVRPRLVSELMVDGKTDTIYPVSYIRERICSEENAAKLRMMLRDVVFGDHGTAKLLRTCPVEIAGKTGTCFDIVGGHYDPSKKRLAFCGFFPYENPKYTVMVLMNHANCGAARSSGMVLYNIASKMYARGMLDKHSDYRIKSESDNHKKGILHATQNKEHADMMARRLNIRNANHFKTPTVDYPEGKMPSVIGLGLKDALAVLEKAGLNVRFKGVGYVNGQSIKAGTTINPGTTVTLSLIN